MTPLNSRLLTLFRGGGLAPPGPAWALYLMDEGDGQTLYDRSGNGRDMWLGLDGTTETADPAWTTVGGVPCLEFAGAQVCYAKVAETLPQPFTLLSIVRSTEERSYEVIVQVWAEPAFRGLQFRTSWRVTMHLGKLLADDYAPSSTWIGAAGVANGANSAVWFHGSTPTVGNVGTYGMTHLLLGALLSSGVPLYPLFGHIAAVAVLEGAASQEYATAWIEYMAAVKGVTL